MAFAVFKDSAKGLMEIYRLLFPDDVVMFGEILLRWQINCGLFQRRLAAYGLKFHASKCAEVHLRCGSKRKGWFVALRPQVVIDENSVKNTKVVE